MLQVISTTLWREGPKLIQKELYQIHSQGVRDKIPSQKSVVNRVDWAKDVTGKNHTIFNTSKKECQYLFLLDSILRPFQLIILP